MVQPNSPPTAEDIKRIAGVADPVIRNLRITECYSRLAASMARRTYACANWCTFATWASKQAGALREVRIVLPIERYGGELPRGITRQLRREDRLEAQAAQSVGIRILLQGAVITDPAAKLKRMVPLAPVQSFIDLIAIVYIAQRPTGAAEP